MKLQPLLPGWLLAATVAVFVAQPTWTQVMELINVNLPATSSGVGVISTTANCSMPVLFVGGEV